MDLYMTSLALGGVGLVAMAFSGSGRHGQHGSHGHGSGHSHAQAHNASANSARGASRTSAPSNAHASAHSASTSIANTLVALMSPRLLFTVCLGLGTTGILLRGRLSGALLFGAALVGGILFDRLLVNPIWNFTFRFASNPALTLESALMGDATAVTRFDANGQGIIAIEVDGQMVQLLGTLQADDRALGARVLAGARLRVDDVDAARNRCTVSLY
jgi:hypothetical protein